MLLLGAYGVDNLFLNPGTDSAPLQEAVLALEDGGATIPRLVPSTFEAVSLSAAHGYFEVTGRPQCVFVHVDAGTQNLGAMMHNAYRDLAGVVVMAGRTPYGEDRDAPGGRSHTIHWQQDVPDQTGIVRGYAKWALEVVSPAVLSRSVGRALQLAASEPAGPCYLTISRDVLMAPPDLASGRVGRFAVPGGGALATSAVGYLSAELERARRPLLITSRAGRTPGGLEALGRLAEEAGIYVAESGESRTLNISTESPWRVPPGAAHRRAVEAADLIVLVDCDVPWVPSQAEPAPSARIVQIDPEPTKMTMPLWSFPVDASFRAGAESALAQLLDVVRGAAQGASCERRRAAAAGGPWFGTDPEEGPEKRGGPLGAGPGAETGMDPADVVSTLSHALSEDDLVVEEAVTNRDSVRRHLVRTRPGTLFGAGAPGLGWALGGALGVKLAAPDRRVVSICGDGSFLFGVPTSALAMAAELGLGFLVVVLDNGGYRASRLPVYELFPEGRSAGRGDAVGTRFRGPDIAAVARACHGHGETVSALSELRPALERALEAVDSGSVAVLDVVVSQD